MLHHKDGLFFHTQDAALYYEVAGQPNSPDLVLLHGGFGTMEDWNSVIGYFENNFRIIAIDSRGQGRSTLGSTNLSYSLLQEDIEALLLNMGVSEAHVMGFSDGGIIAYRIAISGRVRVNKLVTIGARYTRDDLTTLAPMFQRITSESWKEKFPATYEDYMRLNPAPDFHRLTEAVKAMWLDTSATGYPDESVKNIKCPALIIRGDKDHLSFRSRTTVLAEMLPDAAFFNIPFAGHEAHKEEAELVGRITKKFLLGM